MGILADYRRWRGPFLDERGALKPQYRPAPLVASFKPLAPAEGVPAIPVPKGPVEVW